MDDQAFNLLLSKLEHLDSRLEKNSDNQQTRYDSLSNKQEQLNLLLQKQQIILEEHQKRSLANEELIGIVRKEAQDGIKAFREEYKGSQEVFKKEHQDFKEELLKKLEPVENLFKWLKTTWSIIKWCGAIAAICTALFIFREKLLVVLEIKPKAEIVNTTK